MKTTTIRTNPRKETNHFGRYVAELESFRQPTTPGTTEERIFFSFGEEADLFGTAEDVERFRGKSSLNWLESAATVAGCRIG